MKKRFSCLTTVLASLIALQIVTGPALAQRRERRPGPSYEQRLWNWLQDSRYYQWAPFPGQDGDFYQGQEPHGALLKTYVNRPVAAHEEDPPPGSIIIKENYNQNKELMAITIMHRSEGYDPQNNDWYWVKYLPDGRVARQNGNKVAGKVKACIQCHQTAKGNDFIFTNDKMAGNGAPNQPAQKQTSAQNNPNSQADTVVEMTDEFAYDPEKVTIQAGQTIEWTNPSQVIHTVTADKERARDPDHVRLPQGAEPFNSGNIPPGETYSRKFTVPGEYRYFCIPHEARGMIGEIEVQPAQTE